MIRLSNINLQRGNKQLLEKASLTIYPGHKVGIVGENGCGKSTLFSLLQGKLDVDAGTCEVPSAWTIAHVEQEVVALDKAAIDYVLDGDRELREIEKQLTEESEGTRLGLLYAQYETIGGYTASARAATLLAGLGFKQQEIQAKVQSFSGGWRMRLNLAKALMCRSDLLLLDEPTNHLDLDAILWLENWLSRYQGTLILISHDRDFLDNVVNEVAHIEHQQIHLYSGGYTAFEKMRAEKLILQQSQYEKQQRQIAHMQQLVDKFRYKASKARQAQSRLKAIANMDVIVAVQSASPFEFKFKPIDKTSDPLLSIKDVDLNYGEKIVLQNINFSIGSTDRIGLLGPNGAGKSTLMKYLAGWLNDQPGTRVEGHHLKLAYFTQHQLEALDPKASCIQHLQRIDAYTPEQTFRNFLGGFAFHGERIFEAIENFSGGEKARLALALLVWQQPNLLLLDEPTNHFDIEMREALNMALQDFNGAVVIISHDRHLLRSAVDEFYIVAAGQLQTFDGDLDDYKDWLVKYQQTQLAAQVSPKAHKSSSAKEKRAQSALQRDQEKTLKQKISKLEKEIASLTNELKLIEKALADEKLYNSEHLEQMKQLSHSHTQMKAQLEKLEIEWLEALEKLEQL